MHHNKLWTILQKMGIPEHPTCLQRNLYAVVRDATVRTGHGTIDWFKTEKAVRTNMEQWTGSKLGK